MTPEQIVPVALFVLFVLFNLVGRWLRGRLQEPKERETAPPAPPPEVPLPPRVRIVTPRPAALEERRSAPRAPARTPARVPPPRRPPRLIATAADARRAIVLMAVFGPCRGLRPDGIDGMQ